MQRVLMALKRSCQSIQEQIEGRSRKSSRTSNKSLAGPEKSDSTSRDVVGLGEQAGGSLDSSASRQELQKHVRERDLNSVSSNGESLQSVPSAGTTRSRNELDRQAGTNTTVKSLADRQPDTEPAAGRLIPPTFFFAGEDETDYTPGASRMVFVEDERNKELAAILPNFDFSQKLQNAALAERRLRQLLRLSAAIGPVVDRFEAIWHKNIDKLRSLKEAYRGDPEKEGKLRQVSEREEALLQGRLEAREARDECQRQTQEALERWQVAQSFSAVQIEAILVHCHLLEPATAQVSGMPAIEDESFYFPFEEDYQELLEADKTEEPVDSASNKACNEAHNALQGAYHNFRFHDREFDKREQEADAETELFNRKGKAGEGLETLSQFHRRQFERTRELTRNLIDAETKYAVAKRQAVDAGVKWIPGAQSSMFPDDSEDDEGSGRDRHHDPQAYIDSSRVLKWLKGIPDANDEDGLAKMQEEDPHDIGGSELKPLVVGDSSSVIAEGSERRRIDRWQKMCEELRAS